MDLKVIENKLVLHLIDHVPTFSAAAVVKLKKKEEIIQHLFTMWISIFGASSKFFSDNGELSNEDYMGLCEAMNITIKKTGGETPFDNGLCECHNAVLEEMFLKTRAEAKCDFLTALQWAVNAKNSLSNWFTDFHHFNWYLEEILDYQMFSQTNSFQLVHRFSPFQLVFRRNLRLPDVLTDKLPALQNVSGSELVSTNLKTMQEARKAYIASKSSERIRRVLRHNVRSSSGAKFFSGDSVYYKRNDSKR